MKLVLKVDEKGNVVVVDGKIVYVDEDSSDKKEYPLDPPSMYTKITELGVENKKHRDKVTAADAKYLAFADIEDLEAYKKAADEAVETVANYNAKDLIDAGKVEKMKAEMKEAYEAKLDVAKNKASTVAKANADNLAGKDGQIRTLMISNRFSVSPHFTGEKSITTMPPDVAEAFFGNNFKVETVDDKLALRAYLGGEEITSLQNPGEPAAFEEAISIIIDKYPNKDHILRAPGGGSGGGGGQGNEGDPKDELTKLQTQLEAAQKPVAEGGNISMAITIKNKISKLQQTG